MVINNFNEEDILSLFKLKNDVFYWKNEIIYCQEQGDCDSDRLMKCLENYVVSQKKFDKYCKSLTKRGRNK